MGEYPLICDVCNRQVSPDNVGQTSADSVLCLACLSRLLRRPPTVFRPETDLVSTVSETIEGIIER